MVLDVIVHKSSMSVGIGGCYMDEKVSAIGVLENNPEPMVEKEGMDTLSMAVSMVGMTCFGVVGPYGS